MVLRKKDSFTVITPIPGFIPRQLAIDILHSHSEVITLNPLVISHKPIAAPQNAETDEYYSTWYEITERVQLVPGIGKTGSTTISFNGCFHDMPWGLQTHIYAPMSIDLRVKYRIAGNQPGFEPPEVPEIGIKQLGAPSDGLYLREDYDIKCNVTMTSFVRSQMKKAGAEMVRRIIKKAELLDAGALEAMIEDGKLKTINPADRRNTIRSPLPSPTSLRYSPSVSGNNTTPPPAHGQGSPRIPYQMPRSSGSVHHQSYPSKSDMAPPPQAGGYVGYATPPPNYGPGPNHPPQELAGAEPHQVPSFAVEMPGDYYHAPANLQPSTNQAPPSHPDHRVSVMSTSSEPPRQPQGSPNLGQAGVWQQGARPVSSGSAAQGYQQPPPDNKGYPQPLAPHQETREEHNQAPVHDPNAPPQPSLVPFGPDDYKKIGAQPQGPVQTMYPQPLSLNPQQPPQYGRGQLAQRYN